jgi:pimeloyl-ACP methyl ester carboxylesterase
MILFLVVGAGASAEASAPGISPELLRPHLVRLHDGRRMNFHCIGSGSPAVVFEQGGEGMVYNWAKVQPAASAMIRACFYDRAGFGWSDPPNTPVTARSVTDDLHELLKRERIGGPIVLVGHSIGGFYATMYADRFPEEVAGLVLLEPGFSGQGSGVSAGRAAVEQANIRRGEGDLLRCAELARTMKPSADDLVRSHCAVFPPDASGPDVLTYASHSLSGPAWYEAEHSQSVNFFSGDEDLSISQREEHDAMRSFDAMPLIVLSAENPPTEGWQTPQEAQIAGARWRAGHEALASRSSVGLHEIVPGSGHFIQLDKPDAVIAAVRDVIAKVRADRRASSR